MLSINIEKAVKIDSRSSEAYKRLRTNIQFCGSNVKTIALTSCIPNEGKSTVAMNLAASMAATGKRVLFVDADLRKSVLVGRYKINQQIKGLTHYLSGVDEMKDIVYATNITNMHVIFSGPVPPNPAELLDGDEFKKMISSARRVYDYVILDTPPLGSVIDAAIIAAQCDGAILVVSQGTVSRKNLKKTVEQLEKAECRILGAVLNKVDLSEDGYYGKYYSNYYGSYYGDYYGTGYGYYGSDSGSGSRGSGSRKSKKRKKEM